MSMHWVEVQSLFGLLAYMVKNSDPDGIEVRFTKSNDQWKSKHTTKLLESLKKKSQNGTCNMSSRLGSVLQEYQSKLDTGGSRKFSLRAPSAKAVRPLSVYVMTDGLWQPGCDLQPLVERMVNSLVKHDLPREQVGIQFIRFGHDVEAASRLNQLDAELKLSM